MNTIFIKHICVILMNLYYYYPLIDIKKQYSIINDGIKNFSTKTILYDDSGRVEVHRLCEICYIHVKIG